VKDYLDTIIRATTRLVMAGLDPAATPCLLFRKDAGVRDTLRGLDGESHR
jgi:hypothetical protein